MTFKTLLFILLLYAWKDYYEQQLTTGKITIGNKYDD